MSSAPSAVQETGVDRAFNIFNYLILTFFLIVGANQLAKRLKVASLW